MANEIYISVVSGISPTVQLYSGATTVGTSFTATEIGTTGEYVASVPSGIPYGYYLVVVTAGTGVKVSSGDLYWDGTKEISPILYERMHRVGGLDATKPATTTTTTIDAGDIHVNLTGDGVTNTTLTATS